jgi:outer membrane lipoprotein-sorting protein
MTAVVRRVLAVALLAWGLSATAATARLTPTETPLSAEQIVEKNLAARGGLQAWRKVETMAWMGHVQGAAGSMPPMPFILQLQRPNLTRFEVSAPERFTRIFDGTHGWRVRPGGNGVPEVKAFSNEEAAFSRDEFVIDGPLMDHAAKGVAVKLAGLDDIDGRKAYLLEITLPGGASRRVWVDAETFLDVRCDRPSTNPLTKGAPVSVYYRDFRSVDGLLIAHTIETRSGPAGSPSQTLTIEKIALNPQLPTQTFTQPAAPMQRGKAVVRVGGSTGAMP